MALPTIRDGYLDNIRIRYNKQLEERRRQLRQASSDALAHTSPRPITPPDDIMKYAIVGIVASIILCLGAFFLRQKFSDMVIGFVVGLALGFVPYFVRLIAYNRRDRQIKALHRQADEQLQRDLAEAERQNEAEFNAAVSRYRSNVTQTADRLYNEAKRSGSFPPVVSWLEELMGTAIQAAPRSKWVERITPRITFKVSKTRITAELTPSSLSRDWDEKTRREWAIRTYEYVFEYKRVRSPITASDADGEFTQCAGYALFLSRVLKESVLKKYPKDPCAKKPAKADARVETAVGGPTAALEYSVSNPEFVPIR